MKLKSLFVLQFEAEADLYRYRCLFDYLLHIVLQVHLYVEGTFESHAVFGKAYSLQIDFLLWVYVYASCSVFLSGEQAINGGRSLFV